MTDVLEDYLTVRKNAAELVKFWQGVPRERFPDYFLMLDLQNAVLEKQEKERLEEEEEKKKLYPFGRYGYGQTGYGGAHVGFPYQFSYQLS